MNKRIKKQFWLFPQEVAELKKKAELAGGIILIILGLKILVEHLGLLRM